ncbi:MAG: type II toxin-antitoxin system HicA family toxin [Bacteroidetes bacterium]|nr:type II toxin-antitoxin system HicA family toxin [Bacteroidota bacterium]
MPIIGPVKRKDLIKYLRLLGFEGPYSGGKHQFMMRKQLRITIPNPHVSDISSGADIPRDQWEKL